MGHSMHAYMHACGTIINCKYNIDNITIPRYTCILQYTCILLVLVLFEDLVSSSFLFSYKIAENERGEKKTKQ